MIIVTGKKGLISLAIKDHLENNGLDNVECKSVRGNDLNIIDFTNVDVIVHVAGVVPKIGITPDDFYAVNRDLTNRLATKAKVSGVKHFIYISSMSVYGMVASLNPHEGTVDDISPCNPTTDYGKSKLMAEISLRQLEDDRFKVAVIRVPSIYSDTRREYFAQYEVICNKFKCIPLAFRNCYRSAITVDNLCELIRLVILNKSTGIICPDNGSYSASDYCAMIHPEMRKSKIIGFCVEKFFKWHPMVKSLFGAVSYSTLQTSIFDGKYRIKK